jgi:hypothetical protein
LVSHTGNELPGNKDVDLGSSWSPGSSPGMIAREPSLAGRAGAAEGAAGSSLARGGAESNKRIGMIFSVVFDIEG